MRINQAGIDLIKSCEGCRLESYLCPDGIPTIGYGHTGPETKLGQVITQHQAETILDLDLERFEKGVTALLKIPISENAFSALVSFAFNFGLGKLARSTLLRKVNAKDPTAPGEFGKWIYGAGKVLPGLVARREEEEALYLTA